MKILGKTFSFVLLGVYYCTDNPFLRLHPVDVGTLEGIEKLPYQYHPRDYHKGDYHIEPVVDRLPGIGGRTPEILEKLKDFADGHENKRD